MKRLCMFVRRFYQQLFDLCVARSMKALPLLSSEERSGDSLHNLQQMSENNNLFDQEW